MRGFELKQDYGVLGSPLPYYPFCEVILVAF